MTPDLIIERNSLFRGLPRETRARIAAPPRGGSTRRAPLFSCAAIRAIRCAAWAQGRVRISAAGPGGKEVFLNIMEPGDAFGEIALLDGSPRTATATAMARTELIIIQRDAFSALLQSQPQLAAHLIQLLCKRVRWTAELMEDTALLSVPARLAKRVLSPASAMGREPERGMKIRLSQEELAQFMGLSRQIVNQHLQTWRAKEWVSLGRGSITLEDPQALEQLVHAE